MPARWRADRRDFDVADFETAWGIGARFHGPHFNALRIEVARGREGLRLDLRRIAAFLMTTAHAIASLLVTSLARSRASIASSHAPRADAARFIPDDPIWREPMTQDVKTAARYEPDLAYQTLENLFSTPGDPVLGQRAKNINTVDEVPDGPYFVNRAGRMPLTPALVARAANTSDGPAPGKWTVVSAKSDGVTPGFTIRDAAEPAVVRQVRSARLARHGHRQRDRRGEIVLGRRLSHRRVPHRPAGAGEPGDRQGHAHHAAGRNARGRCTRATSRGCCRAPIAIPTARIA